MKPMILIGALALVSSTVFAAEVSSVNSAKITHKGNSAILEVTYSTGGCDKTENKPKIDLKLISVEDVTPKWQLTDDPNAIHEFQITMNAVIVEAPRKSPICAMAYDLSVKENLTALFIQKSLELGIDLSAKKAHYGVKFIAPTVVGTTMFSAFDK